MNNIHQKSRKERFGWLIEYIQKEGPVDILNSDFVDAYVLANCTKVVLTCWGANKCQTLRRDLAQMVKYGLLERFRSGVGNGGNWQLGFPKWVWIYSIC